MDITEYFPDGDQDHCFGEVCRVSSVKALLLLLTVSSRSMADLRGTRRTPMDLGYHQGGSCTPYSLTVKADVDRLDVFAQFPSKHLRIETPPIFIPRF